MSEGEIVLVGWWKVAGSGVGKRRPAGTNPPQGFETSIIDAICCEGCGRGRGRVEKYDRILPDELSTGKK